ncbi:carbohydrate ABC transporter permease [Lapidilactobacillus wuchangensis]|uniref:carbohydrate ABC transporter permease n=1 Tax=Lapidilactobacillus wuchangensis TaxID=2486001 RepID=UPI000F7AEB7B|nr:sugar ABC transporter permease [Lapidilactobacillus wuchangensis]
MSRKNVFLVMTIPALLIFLVFHTFPAIQGIFYSFTNWHGYGDWQFVGFKNFINVFKDQQVLDSYLFTFKFAIVATILTNVLSLLIALGLNAKVKFQKTLRALYFIPYILGMLIISFIFSFIFSKVLPDIGQTLHIQWLSSNILGKTSTAWLGIVIVSVWQSTAFNTILYLSGLVTIPGELYEAAGLDGANSWTKFWRITFPMIMPFFTINMVLAMRTFLMAFDQIVALTGGGPGRATESISYVIYKGGFEGGQFAYQSANAVIYFIVIAAISIFQIKVLQKRGEQY